ncbi:MAG: hypothetical protein N2316_01970 [Spirochaetes bacterium]|nr:hypothetical protein [Spirochaetota bacterium]
MNYTLVKQFANNAIDNFFNFFYKWVDFFKLLAEVFFAFLDIWVTFFQIFSNLYLYIYYLFLFVIDKSSQSGFLFFFRRRIPKRVPYMPSKVYVRDIYNPIPSIYGKKTSNAPIKPAATPSQTVKETISATVQKLSNRPSGIKTPLSRKFLEILQEFFAAIKRVITSPVRTVAEYIVRKFKLRPIEEPAGSRRLIDEYMKEYESKRRAQ